MIIKGAPNLTVHRYGFTTHSVLPTHTQKGLFFLPTYHFGCIQPPLSIALRHIRHQTWSPSEHCLHAMFLSMYPSSSPGFYFTVGKGIGAGQKEYLTQRRQRGVLLMET